MQSSAVSVLILGVGNTLLSDEGAGIHALNQVAPRYADQPQISCVDGGTLSFTLAPLIEDSGRFIVLDAAWLDAAPGTVRVFEGAAMDDFILNGKKRSAHEVGLADLLSIALLQGHLPPQRALVGIQPQWLDWGEVPTPPVAAGIEQMCREVDSLLARWEA
jgi:hydrogenase maturation protease